PLPRPPRPPPAPYTTLFRSARPRPPAATSPARQPFRAIVLHACTQCAITPPPRIAAATLTASDISSGVTPASAQAEEYESMQYGDRKSTRLNSSHEWISYAV